MNDLPTGTVTFVFTDVEGSTRLLQQDAGALSAALKVHHEQLSGAAEAHGGVVFERAGDGAFVAFRKASEALAAVLEVQRLSQRPAAGLPRLRLRAAVHSGEVELRGEGYFGPPLFRCARLLAIAHGGQTLVSRAAGDLSIDSLPKGVQLRSLGSHRLRDLPTPEDVFQLVHPDLEAEFPPLRSLDTLPNNLPQQLTSFVGRQEELALVDRLLRSSRLVTITGTGGAGKTRLALQVSAGVAGRYPDGVWLVDLSMLSDEGQMVQQLAAVLGVREEPVRPLLATLADVVRDQVLLLVLDNCEHIVEDAARVVGWLLQSSAGLRVLATSREALGIAGETAWRVPSLASPEPTDVPPKAGDQAAYPAVQLFVDRATSAMPAFALTANNEQVVARITRRLDGIPLAIELAAARVAAIPLEEIAQRLDDVFGLLTSGSRTAPERQQTLRAAIDWSYDQLDPAERALFARLSVFAGGWTLEAAEAIGAALDGAPLDLLTSLVAKSLVVLDSEDGGGRYRYLEPIRAYARLRLGEVEHEEQQVSNAHLDYFVRIAEEAEPHLLGREQARWFGKIEREHDNLRAAVAFAAESGRAEDGLRIVGALWMSWWVNGRFSEGRQMLEKLLPQAPSASQRLRARSLTGAGFLAAARTDFGFAERALEEGLDLARSAGDKRSMAWALHGLGVMAAYRANYEEQSEREREAVELFRQLDDRSGVVPALATLALATLTAGRVEEALGLLEEALEIGQDVGNAFGLNFLLLYLGIAQGALGRDRGDDELVRQSRASLRRSLELSRRVGDRFHVALGLDVLAEHVAAEGDPERATRLLGAAHTLREAIGAPIQPSVRDYQRRVAEWIAAALPEAVFRQRWQEGLAISMDEAIGYADGAPEPPSPSGPGL